MPALRQPVLGITATLVIMGLSFGFIALFDGATFTGWVSYYLMCTVPVTLVLGADKRAAFAHVRQPIRGVLLLSIALVVGLVVAAVQFVVIGGGINPLSPILLQATIASVVVGFWMIVIWGGWPFTLERNPVLSGAGLLIACYAITYVLFEIFFDYEFLRGTPAYSAELDPSGMFDGWSATAFLVVTASIMFLMLHFDLWPLTRTPLVMRQPVLGLVWMAIVLALSIVVLAVGTGVLGLEPPVFIVNVSIPFIFGTIVVLNVLGGRLFARRPQPAKGVCSVLTAAVVGTVLALIYRWLAPVLTEPVPSGPPAFALEVWLASALLAVAFPFLAYYTDLFKMWPLAGAETPWGQDSAETSAGATFEADGQQDHKSV